MCVDIKFLQGLSEGTPKLIDTGSTAAGSESMLAPLNLLQSTSRFTTILAPHNTTTASANLSDDGEMKVLMTFPVENKTDPHQIFRLLIIYDLNIASDPSLHAF